MRWSRAALLIGSFSVLASLAPSMRVGSIAPTGEVSPVATPSMQDGVESTGLVAKLTGPDSVNETDDRFGVSGTDLGHTFEYRGEVYMVFGDTFGAARGDWRSNAAAIIRDADPTDGLTFERMIEDRPGHAKELLPSKKVAGDEITVIPTSGVAVGDRLVLHYMSVREWGLPGRWELNHSGLAYSDDAGQAWVKDPEATWPGDSNFGQVAIVTVDRYVYLFGIPGGRFGGVKLARVELERILDPAAYDYWTGTAWSREGESAAVTVVPAPVGELSVRWNSHYRQWLMTYLNEHKAAIVLRTADCLTGPWSEERTIVTATDYPQLYAPYLLPTWNDGAEIFFTMSLFGPYNIYLMETRLTDVPPSQAPPECAAPG